MTRLRTPNLPELVRFALICASAVATFVALQALHLRAVAGAAAGDLLPAAWLGTLLYLLVLVLPGCLLLRLLWPRLLLGQVPADIAFRDLVRQSFARRPRSSKTVLAGALLGGCALAAAAALHSAWSGRTGPTEVGNWPELLVVVSIRSVLEEFFYRSCLQHYLARANPTLGWLLQAILFALMHPVAVFAVLFLVGLALGGLYWRHGVLPAIVAHVSYNAALIALAGLGFA